MLSRSVVLLLALLLFWAAFTPQEPARSAVLVSGAQVELQVLDASASHEPSGSIELHPGDDPPAPAQAEGGMDLPALIPHLAGAPAFALGMVRPGPHLVTAWVAPTLDGLRRPPRPAHLAA